MTDVRKLKLEELGRVSVPSFKSQDKVPIIVVLDNLRSGLNVGSFFRSADSFAIQEICLCGITPQPPHKEILKSAIGASLSVSWRYEEHINDALRQYSAENYTIVGIEQTTKSKPLHKYDIDVDTCHVLVFGNEVEGISESALGEIHDFVDIPQYGTKHSLNVAVCGGIVLHHFATVKRKN